MRTWPLAAVILLIVYACSSESRAPVDPPEGKDSGTVVTPDGSVPVIDSGGSVEAGCVTSTYYADKDRDGFGAGPAIQVCEPVDLDGGGYSRTGDDCDDADERAFPGQTVAQEGLRRSADGGDFNCDGTETKTHTKGGGCGCPGWQPGYIGAVAPCGAADSWMDFCSVAGPSLCNQTIIQQKQRCL